MAGAESKNSQGQGEAEPLSPYQWVELSEWTSNQLKRILAEQSSKEYTIDYVLQCLGGGEATTYLLHALGRARERKQKEIQDILSKGIIFGIRQRGIGIKSFEQYVRIHNKKDEPNLMVPRGLVLFCRYGSVTRRKHTAALTEIINETNQLFLKVGRSLVPSLPYR